MKFLQVEHPKRFSIALICVCQVLAMTLWFSATAIQASATGSFKSSLFTSAVQLGLVVGTLISASLGLPDIYDPRRLFMASSICAGISNAFILVLGPENSGVVLCRFLTGVCLAGVYPVGMKMAASWAKKDMGLVVGLIVGALTVGSASPHLFNALGGLAWQPTIAVSSILAITSGILILGIGLGPHCKQARKFNPSDILHAWRKRPLRFVNIGYFGHMWELYAMWAWLATFLSASFLASMPQDRAMYMAKLVTFATIASGCIGSLAAGYVADRIGRTRVTVAALTVSGLCSLTIGLFFHTHPIVLTVVCAIWGLTVVADSAQFSAGVAELSDPSIVGTMLTIQTSVGFLITLITIHLTPIVASAVGWQYAFAPLAIGPVLGIIAITKLRRMPEVRHLANGRG